MKIEAFLNLRPLKALSEDPNVAALMPAHVLFGTSFQMVFAPDEQFSLSATNNDEVKYGMLSRWQHQRFDGSSSSSFGNVSPCLYLCKKDPIYEDNVPPQIWNLVRVTATIAGRTNKVRVIDLRTKKGSLQRPIHKIAPLPITNFTTETTELKSQLKSAGLLNS